VARARRARRRRGLERILMARILAVDDSAAMRRIVGATLQAAGHEVIEARDGDEALSIARDSRVDLVLTDLNMPGLDGIGLVRALRELPAYARTPLFVLTTESSVEHKRQGREAGATGWVVKPFHPERLIRLIAGVLE